MACDDSTGQGRLAEAGDQTPGEGFDGRAAGGGRQDHSSARQSATGQPAGSSPRSTPRPARSCGASTPFPSRASRAPTPGNAPRQRIPAAGRPAARLPGRRRLRSGVQYALLGHRQPGADVGPRVPPGRQPLLEFDRCPRRRHRQAEVVLPVHARATTTTTTRSAPSSWSTSRSTAKTARYWRTSAATASSIRWTARTAPSSSGQSYINKLSWTKGLDPKTGLPIEYDPSKSLQTYAAAANGRGGETSHLPEQPGRHELLALRRRSARAASPMAPASRDASEPTKKPVDPADVRPVSLRRRRRENAGATKGAGVRLRRGDRQADRQDMLPYPNYAGVWPTPGPGLGRPSSTAPSRAYDTKTLEPKWSINVGNDIRAADDLYRQRQGVRRDPLGRRPRAASTSAIRS